MNSSLVSFAGRTVNLAQSIPIYQLNYDKLDQAEQLIEGVLNRRMYEGALAFKEIIVRVYRWSTLLARNQAGYRSLAWDGKSRNIL